MANFAPLPTDTDDSLAYFPPAEARRYIEALTGDADSAVTFQILDDPKKGLRKFHFHATLTDAAETLAEQSNRGAGIFLMVNAGDGEGREAKNVLALRALFVDYDSEKKNLPVPPSFPLEPTFAVKTGRGWHYYWALEVGESLDGFEKTQKALAKHYGDLDPMSDLPRVLRVPGYPHQKAEPRPVSFHPMSGERYTIAEVLQAHGVAKGKRFGEPTGVEGNRDISLFKFAMATLDAHPTMTEELFESTIVGENAGYKPPQPPEDVARVTRSAWNNWHGKNPPKAAPSVWTVERLGNLRAEEPVPLNGFAHNETLFIPGEVSATLGAAKLGKTYVTMLLAHAIASGEPLGPMNTRKGRALYISLEMSRESIKRRIHYLFGASDQTPLDFTFDRFIADAEGLATLQANLESLGEPGIAFLDTLGEIKGGAKESDNDDMRTLFQGLRDVARATGWHLNVIAHRGKPGPNGEDREVRGASVVRDIAESMLSMDRKKGGVGTCSTLYGRNSEVGETLFTYTIKKSADDPKRPDITIGGTELLQDISEDFDISKELASMLEPRSVSELARFWNVSRATAQRKVDRMLERGKAEEVGTTQRGGGKLYQKKEPIQ